MYIMFNFKKLNSYSANDKEPVLLIRNLLFITCKLTFFVPYKFVTLRILFNVERIFDIGYHLFHQLWRKKTMMKG